MIATWVLRYRAGAPHLDRKQVIGRLGILGVWVVALVLVPLVAKPGGQPGWTPLITLITAITMRMGARDLRELKKP